MVPPSTNEETLKTKVKKLRVQELKTLLKECMIPSDGRKEVLEERLLQFCTFLTSREKDGIFRLLHVEGTNINEKYPVTLPHHLGPLTLVSGGDKKEPDGRIPLGYESVRRFYIEAKDNSKDDSQGVFKVFTLHYLKCRPAQSNTSEVEAPFVSQVSIDTPKGIRTFQSPDPSAAFYTAVKRILEDSEDLSQREKDLLLRKAYTISSRGLGRKLMGIDIETRVGERVKRATDRQHQRGCYRGTAIDVACLNRFAHLSKYNSLPCIPLGHKAPPPSRQTALKPWEAPAHVAPLAPLTEENLAPVLEVFFPMWELKKDGILLSAQPIEGGRGRFSVDGKPKAGDKDKYFFCVSEENQRGLSGDEGFPHKLKVHLNDDTVLTIPKNFERVDLTQHIKTDVNTLRTEVAVAVDTPAHYFVVLKLSAKSEDALVAQVKAQAVKLDKAQALGRLRTFIEEQDAEVEVDKVTVDLQCPISRMRMETPARGLQCTHMQCFDARWFMTVFEGSRNQRKCTVCQKPIPTLKDLVVDDLQVKILQTLKNDPGALSVHLAKNGTWSVADREKGTEDLGENSNTLVDESTEGTGRLSPSPLKRRHAEEGERGEEEGPSPKKKPKVESVPSPPEVEVIDVDAADDDGEEVEEALCDDFGHPIDGEVGRHDGGSFFNMGGGDLNWEEEFRDVPGTGEFDHWFESLLGGRKSGNK
eukprot:CAMPEP_0113879122 /NCGR_PEP_ID=MMETSP0780_2-20120614/7061_1 /TAXON_ID=652834 /ORGANISM="Palpitomonas bilix" /LENGTH=698 /DNA_ID=CAMNT_0000865665 /DNA_START=268 /DNA_END=2365 /DNA_ORIENTATION=+ /assembly_acc=CAM_ASM_000599